jgi:hypothetical protein
MRFRNVTQDTLHVPSLGVSVPPGETTPELEHEGVIAGFIHQVERWVAVGKDDKAVQKEAVTEAAKPPDPEKALSELGTAADLAAAAHQSLSAAAGTTDEKE